MVVKRRWKLLVLSLCALLATVLLAVWQLATPPPVARAGALAPIRIATPVQISAGAIFVAEQRQMFAEHQLAVELKRFLLGKQALQAMIGGKADLAVVADTPFVLSILHGQPIAVLGTIYESRKTIAILGRRDHGVHNMASLDGKRVGTVLGTNAEFFLDSMFEAHGVRRAQVHVVGNTPERLPGALRAGEVDAITVWNPDLVRLEQALGSNAVTIYGEDLFVYRFLLVAKQSYIASHQRQLQDLLKTIRQANDVIRDEPDAARALLGKTIGLEPDLLRHAFDPADYTLTLDQSLLLSISAEMRWATEKELAPAGTQPDYTDYVRGDALSAVAPDANRIIR
jgi:ABC-type nitrate/sulfonate/bicarbonate transport system substrate-binding protein